MEKNPTKEAMGFDSFPNEARNDKWKLTISNIPDYDGEMLIFDNFIRNFSTPSVNSGEAESRMGFISRQMLSPEGNKSLYELSLSMTANEGMENYAILLAWWHRVMFGRYPQGTILHTKKIDFVNIHQLDNQKNTRLLYHLRGGMVTSIGGYQMQSGASEIITFDVGIKFDRFDFSVFDRFGNLTYCTDDLEP